MQQINKVVVYCAIANNYNALLNPSVRDAGFDYVCFTDQPLWFKLAFGNTVWRIRSFPREVSHLEPTRKCRMVKILPHHFFPEYEYSVWVDGSIDIIGDIHSLIAQYENAACLGFRHPLRACVYEEGRACIQAGKDDPALINRQLEHYRTQGLPENNGLIESNVLIRRHNDPQVIQVMEEWWRELSSHSRRDQLSFPYAAWRHDFWPTLMGEDNVWGASQVFRLRRESFHGGKPLTLSERMRILADRHLLWRFKR
jgi:hypothetical protein